jgi:hypothetical protein
VWLCIVELLTAILFAALRYIRTSFSHILAVKPNLMKRSLFALIYFAALSAGAQEHTGIYIASSVGVTCGGFNANSLPPNGIYSYENWSYKAGVGFKTGLTVGYERPRWSANTGITLLDQWSYGSEKPYSTYSRSERIQMRYLLFPLSVSYRAAMPHKGRPVWLVPSAGIEIGRLTACLMDYKEAVAGSANYPSSSPGLFAGGTYENYGHEIMSKEEMELFYNRTNFWLTGKLDIEISGGKSRAWTVGPEFHYMISNLSKLGNEAAQAYALSFNVGYKLFRH